MPNIDECGVQRRISSLLEVEIGSRVRGSRFIGDGPDDDRGPILVSGHQLSHHLLVVLQRRVAKVIGSVITCFYMYMTPSMRVTV